MFCGDFKPDSQVGYLSSGAILVGQRQTECCATTQCDLPRPGMDFVLYQLLMLSSSMQNRFDWHALAIARRFA